MANEWNTSYPIDHTTIGGIPGEIRALKTSTKTQIDREHETPVDGDATGGEHSSGSAVAYEGTSTPTNRPDGATALADNAIDRGRLWLDDNGDPPNLKRWTGSAFTENVRTLGGWTPTSYVGAESVTYPNGMIVKSGLATFSSGTITITFGTAFPNAIKWVQATPYDTAALVDADYMAVTAYSTTAITIKTRNSTFAQVFWEAKGY